MRTVPLHGKIAAGRVALIDDGDYDLVMQYRWHAHQGGSGSGTPTGPYAMTRPSRRQRILMHHLIMGCKGIDHINHNGLDNQRSNLRKATQGQNVQNARKRSTPASSAFKGVFWDTQSRKWKARLQCKGKCYYLGYHTDEIAAARAYDAKALEMFGEFACLNFPDGK